jgi:hypothetical protein
LTAKRILDISREISNQQSMIDLGGRIHYSAMGPVYGSLSPEEIAVRLDHSSYQSHDWSYHWSISLRIHCHRSNQLNFSMFSLS